MPLLCYINYTSINYTSYNIKIKKALHTRHGSHIGPGKGKIYNKVIPIKIYNIIEKINVKLLP